MNKINTLLLALFTLIFSNVSHSWAALGHQVVCDIAWQESTSSVRQQLAASAKRMGYDTFASACVWADHVRAKKQYDWLKPLHYMNAPRRAKTVDIERDCGTGGFSFFKAKKAEPTCILNAINYFSKRVTQKALGQQQQDEALLMLGHLVGDIHQPLHVGYKDDRGGTRTDSSFKGKRSSLHYFWDKTVLQCGKFTHWRKLSKQLGESNRQKLGSSEPKEWANQSLALTHQLYSANYKLITPASCQQYQKQAFKQLQLAGIRLADQLAGILR